MIFPLAGPALTVLLNGEVVRSYRPALLREGRVRAPLEPFLSRIAAAMQQNGSIVTLTRGDRFVQVRINPRFRGAPWEDTYVAIGPILRTLGLTVSYDAAREQLSIETPPATLSVATPFNPAVPRVSPSVVFTPSPERTPVPAVTGSPVPRRTPLPCCKTL